MSFKIKKADLRVSDQELTQWEQKLKELRTMHSFHGVSFSEGELLSYIITSREEEMKRLINSFGLNSDRFSFTEMEAWKRKYNDASTSKNLHLRLYFVRLGCEFEPLEYL